MTKVHGNTKHGMRGTPTYHSWVAMKGRCLNVKHKDYPKYGGKGVTVCDEWVNSFEAFYRDMGVRPNRTTIDRVNTNKNYNLKNCRWATRSEQQKNKTTSCYVEINGITYDSLYSAADAHKVSATTIVRWCDGYEDKRRSNQKSGGRKSAKKGCRRYKKY